jgi:hypothetical protein
MWDKTKAWFKHSLTILWARVLAFSGLLLVAADTLIADQNVIGAIQSVLQPKYVPYFVVVIGILTELARRRTIGKV